MSNPEWDNHNPYIKQVEQRVDDLSATIARLTRENGELRAMNARWVKAATKHYPLGWAMDPGNPELAISNVAEGARKHMTPNGGPNA